MTINGWIKIALYFVVLTALVVPLGRYMARVFEGERTFFRRCCARRDRALSVAGVDTKREQGWMTYAVAMLLFNAAGFLVVYGLHAAAGVLPLNPADQSAVPADLSFNTAVSFATNTNWQNYGGESTLSYLTQMVGLTTQNFVSAATGIALAIALIRGFARASAKTVGNFWVDLTRCTLYILLPLSIVAPFPGWQGVPQNLGAYVDATTLEGAKQILRRARSPRRSRSSSSAPTAAASSTPTRRIPYENPTPLSNFVEMLYILLIRRRSPTPSAAWSSDAAAGLGDLAAMSVIFLGALVVCYWAEAHGNPTFAALGLDPAATWKARRSVSASPIRACGRRRRRLPPTARSTRCTKLHAPRRHDAAGHDRAWRDHLSAASAPASTACCCTPSSRYSSPA